MVDTEEFRKILLDKKAELERRITNIGKHAGKPLDSDSKEASIELQNDEVLQGLDDEAREELLAIQKALLRIDKNTYSQCASCQETIPIERLRANPFSDTCIDCARAAD